MFFGLPKKPVLLAAILAGAAGGPYVSSETQLGRTLKQSLTSLWDAAPGHGSASNSSLAHFDNETLWNYNGGNGSSEHQLASLRGPDSGTLVGGPIHDLRDVLRFDISPRWVSDHFTRVSTVLAELNLDGLRVPIVTGTADVDLAGTLTYYFDRQQRLQRINLQGFTGEPQRVTDLLVRDYYLQPQAALGGGLYVTRWNGQVTSLLKVSPAPIIYADSPRSRYSVFLEINQPSMPYGLSHAASTIVGADRETYRW
jgi:hypothetical protein